MLKTVVLLNIFLWKQDTFQKNSTLCNNVKVFIVTFDLCLLADLKVLIHLNISY